MVKKQKRALYSSLVGFLKSKSEGSLQDELWLERCWGKKPVIIQMLDDQVVWIQFLTEIEVEEVLQKTESKGLPSTFAVLERWMQILGSPPSPGLG